MGPGGHAHTIWGPMMNPPPGHIRTNGMIITKVWSLRPEVARDFARRFPGVQVVEEIWDLVGTVDGVFLDDVNAVSLYHLIARPFLEAGMPTFVNRPFATSLEKGRDMVERAERSGAPLLSASTWEFSESVGDLRAKVAELGDIKGYVAHNSMSDFYTHGIHGVWYVHAVMRDEMRKGRGRVRSAAYLTEDWRTPNGVVIYEHEAPGGPYYGSLLEVQGADGNAYIRVFGDGKDVEGKIPARPGYFLYNTWNALLLAVQEMIETKASPQTGEDLLEKLTMFLMPFRSALERGGAPVSREEIEGWELPPPTAELKKNGQPTDIAFRNPYTLEELERAEKLLCSSY